MRVPVLALLLSLVYAAALAVALADVGSHALAGAVVLVGLTTRWALRHQHRFRHRTTAPGMGVLPRSTASAALEPDAAPAAAVA